MGLTHARRSVRHEFRPLYPATMELHVPIDEVPHDLESFPITDFARNIMVGNVLHTSIARALSVVRQPVHILQLLAFNWSQQPFRITGHDPQPGRYRAQKLGVAGRMFATLYKWRHLIDYGFISRIEISNTLITLPKVRRVVRVGITFGPAVPRIATQSMMVSIFHCFVRDACILHHAHMAVLCCRAGWTCHRPQR
jgi:hypothetical protein